MTRKHTTSRRDFFKYSTRGAAALALSGTGIKAVMAATADGYKQGSPINPNIDGRNVVYVRDMKMITNEMASSFHKQNEALNAKLVKKHLDDMAGTLAGKETADEAWATIFQKPDDKEWSQVKVFIKTNGTIESIMGHIPVASKVCEELIKLCVKGEWVP